MQNGISRREAINDVLIDIDALLASDERWTASSQLPRRVDNAIYIEHEGWQLAIQVKARRT